jgi:sugar/nucleoside kinase (ribokinase family)
VPDYDIAFVGHMCIDEILPFEGERQVAPGSAVLCGALTAARVGRRVAAVVKMSPADDAILQSMRDAGVAVFVIPAPQTTWSRVVHPVPDVDVRRITIEKHAGLLRVDEVPEIDCRFLHLAGISDREFDLALIEGLASRGHALSVDMQAFVRQVSDGTGEVAFGDVPAKARIASLVSRVKMDALEAEILTGTDDIENAARIFEGYGCLEVMITRADGVLVRAEGRTLFERFTNRTDVGRTGRGDTTFAAYLARRMEHGPAESLKFAAALVSIKMESAGPFSGTLEDVLARMKAAGG